MEPELRFPMTSALKEAMEILIKEAEDEQSVADVIRSAYKKVTAKVAHFDQWFKRGAERARAYNRAVDVAVAKRFKEGEALGYQASCHSGCSACCQMLAMITDDEGELLAGRVIGGVEIDREKLERHARYPVDPEFWFKIPREEARCVFLGEDNRCRVYEDRPVACRLHHSLSDPRYCEPGPGGAWQKVAHLFNYEGQILASASLWHEENQGSIAMKTLAALKMKETKNG